jgi:hypothetical protein
VLQVAQEGGRTVVQLGDGTTLDLGALQPEVKDQRPRKEQRAQPLPTDLAALAGRPDAHVFVRLGHHRQPPRLVIVVGAPEPAKKLSKARPPHGR